MTLNAGARVGPYVVLERVGSGGMGEVFRARDERLGRDVAIKVVAAERALDSGAMARLEQEARAAAALSHPHIVAVFDVGTHEGRPFIVSELLSGETLRSRMQAAVPTRKALEWASQIADALSAAHGRGIVHRDIKPENIWITSDDRVKVLDFGLSKLVETSGTHDVTGAATAQVQTAHGIVVGTVGYMSPEQVTGGPVDSRSDLFSLGVVLYEMLARQRAFQRATGAETMTAILRDDVPAPSAGNPAVPAAADLIVRRCLEKTPAARFQSAADLAFALVSASTVSGIQQSVASRAPFRAPSVRSVAAGAVFVAATAMLVRYVERPSAAPARSSKHFEIAVQPALSESFVPFAIASDGSTIVYTAGSHEGSQAYVRPMNRVDAVLIPGTLGARDVFFFPDGRSIGFRSNASLVKTAIAGGAVVRLAPLPNPNAFGGAWVADAVVYYSFAGSIWRVAADGASPPERVASPNGADPAQTFYEWPQVLPGNTHLLVTSSDRMESARLMVMRTDGADARVVVENAAYGRYVPTGHLLYAQAGTIFAQRFDPATRTPSGSPAAVIDGVAMSPTNAVAQFAAADDGTIVFVRGASLDGRSLAWVDRHGGRESVADVRQRRVMSPVLSPDGERFAAVVEDKTGRDAWIYERATRAFSRLTIDGQTALGIAWTPDSRALTFVRTERGRSTIVSQSIGGDRRAVELLTAPESLWVGGWSGDGQFLGVMRSVAPGNGNVDVFDVKTGKAEAVVNTPATEWGARLSPDARWMAYVSNRTGRWEVFVQPFPGPGSPRQVSTDGGVEVVWARSGRELFFRNGSKMMAAPIVPGDNLSIGAPVVLFDAPLVLGSPGLPNYDVSPDGQHFLMVEPAPDEITAKPLQVLVDWFSELRRLTAAAPR